ncbi:unnamed protein product, partial [Mesorhabditis spiculigera]
MGYRVGLTTLLRVLMFDVVAYSYKDGNTAKKDDAADLVFVLTVIILFCCTTGLPICIVIGLIIVCVVKKKDGGNR